MFVRSFSLAVLACAAALSSATAQDSTSVGRQPAERVPSEFELRSSGSLSFTQSRPTGDLQQNIGFGYGIAGAYLFRLDHAGALSLRADIGVVGYGDESFQAPLSTTIGGRIQVDVHTNNYIVPMSIGPQLTWPTGRIRPYVNAGIGGQAFYTESKVEGTNDSDDFASTTNQSDWTPTWVAGGGLYMPIYQGKTNVLVDVGVQYYGGGRAQYLRPGSIQDLPNAQTIISVFESETHLLLVRLGVKIGL